MNNISLKKVTLVVSACVLASYFVNANEKVENLKASSVKVASLKSIAKDIKKKEANNLPENLPKLDNAKSSSINKAEVKASKSKVFVAHLKDID